MTDNFGRALDRLEDVLLSLVMRACGVLVGLEIVALGVTAGRALYKRGYDVGWAAGIKMPREKEKPAARH